MQDARTIDTTMGFAALDGLVMGTLCGRLDPGELLDLLQEKQLSAAAVQQLLDEQNIIFIYGLRYGDGEWTGGHIYAANSGRTYKCNVELQGNKLNLRGFVGVSLVGPNPRVP